MAVEVVRVDTVAAASAILAAEPGARFVGGGTLVVRACTSGDLSIDRLVLCDGLGLDTIRIDNGRAEVGAAVTMAMLAARPELELLSPVARGIGGPAVRAMATVGGNLFAPSPYGDLAVALLALGAEVNLEARDGTQTLDLARFLEVRGAGGGVVRSVAFAIPPAGSFRFAKAMRRHPHGAAVLSIAAVLPLVEGRMQGARVAYGAMAPTPIRAAAVERALDGRTLDEAAIAAAVAVATEGCAAASDPFASDWYRLNVLPVHLARLLRG